MVLSALLFLWQVAQPPAVPQAVATPLVSQAPSQSGAQTAHVPQPIAGSTPTISKVAIGRTMATQNCQSCHAIGRSGRSPNPAAPKFRNLSQKYPIDDLSEAFAEGVLIGHSVMPQFEFTPDRVDALMAYIKSIQAPARPKRAK